MKDIKEVLKIAVLVMSLFSLFLICGFFCIQMERSDIVELRFCPHCGVELLR